MQLDGNLAIIVGRGVLGERDRRVSRAMLKVLDDGNVVIYDVDAVVPRWATHAADEDLRRRRLTGSHSDLLRHRRDRVGADDHRRRRRSPRAVRLHALRRADRGADVTNTRQFAGKERDQETGLDYSGARYYASQTGRFTTVDPDHVGGNIEDPQSWNGYADARNNPLRFIDPLGFAPCPPITDTSTCVEGTAGTGQLVFDLARWQLEAMFWAYWNWRTQDVPVMAVMPLAPDWRTRRSLLSSGTTRFGPLETGPLPAGIANTFRSGSYTATTLTRSTTLFQVYGGTASKLGSFWTRTPPRGPLQSAMDLSLNPQ
jgi:RHS repeat-associated protein